MSRVLFDEQRPDLPADPNRADIACFVGLVRRTGAVIPADVRAALQAQGLLRFPFAPPEGQLVPPVAANVRTWLAQQGWLQGLGSRPLPVTTLSAAVGAAAAALPVGPIGGGGVPPTILVDAEIMTAGAGPSAAVIPVARGQKGTAAAPHRLGTPVYACAGSLASAVTASALQLTLAAPLPGNPPAFIRIDDEILAVTVIDGSQTVLTVQRGLAGTATAAHAAPAAVLDLTGDALALLAAQIAAGIPPRVQDWLGTQGWLTGQFARDLDQLADVPVPVESFAGFTAMFDPGGSPSSSGTDYVATAVRSFFAQGGKRCYVVRMADPVGPADTPASKLALLQSLLLPPQYTAGDPSTWHGIGHLAGLPDVSFAAVPDLPVLCASAPAGAFGRTPAAASGPEQFAECAQQDVTPPQRRVYPAPAPRLSPSDYGVWAASVVNILQYLVSGPQRAELHLREMQLVAAFPLPVDLDAAAAAERPSSAALSHDVHAVLQAYLPEFVEPPGGISGTNVSSAFLQLAYPWLKTTGSSVLLESLEAPDGALTGILARNALKRGTFTNATKIVPAEIYDLWPVLTAADTTVSSAPLVWDNVSPKALIERLSVFGFTPAGLRLLSDVTAYPGEAYRTACVNRLVAVIARAARNLGTVMIFQSNGPALWARITSALQRLLTTLWSLNALDGATAADAFSVRCDSSTMTQNDRDNGRLVAEVTFTPAATIELMRITLAVETGGASTQQVAGVLAEAV